MQRVTPDIGDTFGTVDKTLRDSFITDLFQGIGEVILVWGLKFSPTPIGRTSGFLSIAISRPSINAQ